MTYLPDDSPPATPQPSPSAVPVEDSIDAPRATSYYLLTAAMAFASSLPGLLMGFHADDWFQIRPRPLAMVLATFNGDWNEGAFGQGGFFRPLVRCSFALDQVLHGSSALGCHLTNAILYTLAAVALARLAWMLCGERSPWALACLGALFVLNPLRCESLFWVSGRTDLLAGTFVLWGTSEALAALAANSMARAGAALGLLAAGLLSKEVAIAGCVILPAGALLLSPGDGSRRRLQRLLVVGPPLLGVAYLLHRTRVLGGVAGYERADPIGIPEVLSNLGAMLSALLAPWQADGPAAFRPWLALPVGTLCVALCVLNGFRRPALFCLIAVVSSIIPMALIRISPTDGCRVLFLPMGYLALFFCGALFHRWMAAWLKVVALGGVLLASLTLQGDHLVIVSQMLAARKPCERVTEKARALVERLPDGAVLVVPEPPPSYPRRILAPGVALLMAVERDWLLHPGRTSGDGSDASIPRAGLWLEGENRRVFLAPNLQGWMERGIKVLRVDPEGGLDSIELERRETSLIPADAFREGVFRVEFADEERGEVHALEGTGDDSGRGGWSAVALLREGKEMRLEPVIVRLDGTVVQWVDTTALMGMNFQGVLVRRVTPSASFQLRTLKRTSYRSNQSSNGELSSP